MFEKDWPLEPPVTKKLGVEWNGHNWEPIVGADAFDIGKTLLNKMARVFACRHFCRRTIVKFFWLIPAGHAMIFNAGKFLAVRGEWRFLPSGRTLRITNNVVLP